MPSKGARNSPPDPTPPAPLPLGEGATRRLLPWMFTGYVLMILAGVAVFHLPGSLRRGNEMNYDRALFAAVNASTLTGFQVAVPASDYLAPGRAILGIMTVGGTLFTLIVGGWAVVRVLRLPYSDRSVVLAAVGAELFVAFVGATALFGGGNSTLPAVFQALCAFGNSGLYLGRLYGLGDWQTHGVLLPLAVLGGLGLPVLMELADAFRGRKPLSRHARTVLGTTAALYLIGLVLFLVLQGLSLALGDAPGRFDWRDALAASSAMALNTRTAGLPFKFLYAFPRTLPWAMLAFMAVGASPGGTGGGLKTTTLVELYRGVKNALAGEKVRRTFGIAATWAFAYLAAAVATLLLLAVVDPAVRSAPDRMVLLTVSALSNVGLSYEAVVTGIGGQIVLAAAMLFGRLAPLVILWWMADTTHDADLAVG